MTPESLPAAAVVVDLLRPDDALLVYPLVRTVFPAMGRGSWMRAARRALRVGSCGRQGILVARHAPSGRPCGLISFHCDPDMHHGRVLTAEHFVALTFGDVGSVLDAFLPVLEGVARKAGCGGARVILSQGQQALLPRLATRAPADGPSAPFRTFIETSQNMA